MEHAGDKVTIRRLAGQVIGLIFTLLLVSGFIFVATEVLPVDPATAALGQDATPERVAALRSAMNLDQPGINRYLEWVGGLVHGDLGSSLVSQVPVAQVVDDRLRNTLVLAVLALVIGTPIAWGLGVVAALKPNRALDVAISSSTLLMSAIPQFVVGSILVLVFAIILGWAPAVTTVPADAPVEALLSSCWLPVATLTVSWAAYLARTVRSAMIDSLASDHVRAARLAGLHDRDVLMRHALPTAMPPAIATSALYAGALIGGIVIVEAVFNYPGLGTLMVSAVQGGDLPMVQSIAMIGAVAWALVNLTADVLIAAVDPRTDA